MATLKKCYTLDDLRALVAKDLGADLESVYSVGVLAMDNDGMGYDVIEDSETFILEAQLLDKKD